MHWVRSVLAVAIAFGVFVVGSLLPRSAFAGQSGGPTPAGMVLGSIGYGVVFAALAGLTAASLAGRRPLAHGLVVAALIAVAALVHPWIEAGANPRWLDVSAILLMAPVAALAAWGRSRLRPTGQNA